MNKAISNTWRILAVLAMLLAAVGAPAGVQVAKAADVTVRAFNVTGGTPSALDNDFLRIDSAIHAAANGTTIKLLGTFNFAEPFAAAAWAKGHDGTAGGSYASDDYEVDVPGGLNDITLTADYLGAATIQGPGDLPAVDLEGFLQFAAGGGNSGWTISNLRIVDFDMSIGLFFESGYFNNFKISHNYIRMAKDLKGVSPTGAESFQNIAIHLAHGTGITVSDNVIDVPGDGVSDASANSYSDFWTYGVAPGYLYSSMVVLQSNTHGGAAYDNLVIENNIVNVIGAQSATPARIIGIWENGYSHTSNITIRNNQFINTAAGNDPALNRQMAFRLTSHSSATTSVIFDNNRVTGASIGLAPMDVVAGLQPVIVKNNLFTNVKTGLILGANENFTLINNTFTGAAGASAGVWLAGAGSLATIGSTAGSTTVSGFTKGVLVSHGAANLLYAGLNNNGTGLQVDNDGTASIHASKIASNTVLGVDNNNGAATVDATGNWWGSPAGPGGSNNGTEGQVLTGNFTSALIDSVTASIHEIGDTGTLDTLISANGLYGVQLRVTHDAGVLTFVPPTDPQTPAGSTHNDAGGFFWDFVAENFLPVSSPTGVRLTGSLMGGEYGHPNAVNVTNADVATWRYTCTAPGTSALMYDLTDGLGTKLADPNGFAIPVSLVGGSVTCVAATASVDGYIRLQGRLGTAATPAGWNDAYVTLTCASPTSACNGYGPYTMVTDATGHYALNKGPEAGSGIALGDYQVTVSRRGYLGAVKANNVTVVAGTNSLNTAVDAPQLLGGNPNNDAVVDVSDLTIIGGAFGTPVTPDTGADINGDGFVNIFDLVLTGSNYNQTHSTWNP